ncbi:hypothetical protein QOZ83_15700 [Romboutsia sedimentorum]|uniref:hypothetical protein n=1 Tax=Romboutsia sedimentorum TaxID=1368474 RepID=UPI0024DED5D8|nr:hypothetical protein [Romboutsia sedimentorum]MDK2587291.1 hypothetical protein [Romboutsia sedimentorum]
MEIGKVKMCVDNKNCHACNKKLENFEYATKENTSMEEYNLNYDIFNSKYFSSINKKFIEIQINKLRKLELEERHSIKSVCTNDCFNYYVYNSWISSFEALYLLEELLDILPLNNKQQVNKQEIMEFIEIAKKYVASIKPSI